MEYVAPTDEQIEKMSAKDILEQMMSLIEAKYSNDEYATNLAENMLIDNKTINDVLYNQITKDEGYAKLSRTERRYLERKIAKHGKTKFKGDKEASESKTSSDVAKFVQNEIMTDHLTINAGNKTAPFVVKFD